MSKQPSPPPPSYNEATTTTSSSYHHHHHHHHHQPNISTALTSLTSLLRTTQAQQSALESHTTSALLPLLAPHLSDLLTRLGTTAPRPPSLAELVLVPASAVGPAWAVASDADPEAGELVQVVRVKVGDEAEEEEEGEKETRSKYDDDDSAPAAGESSASRGFDDWGRWDDDSPSSSSGTKDAGGQQRRRRLWWWDDEGLARRLARQLQPEPKMDRTVVRAAVGQVKEEKKASRWGLFRGSPAAASSPSSSSSSSPAPPPRSGKSATGQGQGEEDVSMSVRAEEVTFRRENEMGIWEATRGWGIVARVRIRR